MVCRVFDQLRGEWKTFCESKLLPQPLQQVPLQPPPQPQPQDGATPPDARQQRSVPQQGSQVQPAVQLSDGEAVTSLTPRAQQQLGTTQSSQQRQHEAGFVAPTAAAAEGSAAARPLEPATTEPSAAAAAAGTVLARTRRFRRAHKLGRLRSMAIPATSTRTPRHLRLCHSAGNHTSQPRQPDWLTASSSGSGESSDSEASSGSDAGGSNTADDRGGSISSGLTSLLPGSPGTRGCTAHVSCHCACDAQGRQLHSPDNMPCGDSHCSSSDCGSASASDAGACAVAPQVLHDRWRPAQAAQVLGKRREPPCHESPAAFECPGAAPPVSDRWQPAPKPAAAAEWDRVLQRMQEEMQRFRGFSSLTSDDVGYDGLEGTAGTNAVELRGSTGTEKGATEVAQRGVTAARHLGSCKAAVEIRKKYPSFFQAK